MTERTDPASKAPTCVTTSARDRLREPLRVREEEADRVRVVLGLREEIRADEVGAGVSRRRRSRTSDGPAGRSTDDEPRDEVLGRRDPPVAGADDLRAAGHRDEPRDPVGAAREEHFADSELAKRPPELRAPEVGARRRRDDDPLHARHLRRDDAHQERRRDRRRARPGRRRRPSRAGTASRRTGRRARPGRRTPAESGAGGRPRSVAAPAGRRGRMTRSTARDGPREGSTRIFFEGRETPSNLTDEPRERLSSLSKNLFNDRQHLAQRPKIDFAAPSRKEPSPALFFPSRFLRRRSSACRPHGGPEAPDEIRDLFAAGDEGRAPGDQDGPARRDRLDLRQGRSRPSWSRSRSGRRRRPSGEARPPARRSPRAGRSRTGPSARRRTGRPTGGTSSRRGSGARSGGAASPARPMSERRQTPKGNSIGEKTSSPDSSTRSLPTIPRSAPPWAT